MVSQFVHPGNPRWWTEFEYPEVRTIITTAVEDGEVHDEGARINRLTATASDNATSSILNLEVSIAWLLMKLPIETTYTLEGKGPTSVIVYGKINAVKDWFELHTPGLTYPGLTGAINKYIAEVQSNEPGYKESIYYEVRSMITPAYQYFHSRFYEKLKKDMAGDQSMRFINPVAMKRAHPTVFPATEL